MSLSDKKCIPCQGGVAPLTTSSMKLYLDQLSDEWYLNDLKHLCRKYNFKSFKYSMDFANKVGDLSELEKHHPILHVSWGKCFVEIWTHKINGLTESDFILAAKIENLFVESE